MDIQPLLNQMFANQDIQPEDYVSVDADVISTQESTHDSVDEPDDDDQGMDAPPVSYALVQESLRSISLYVMQKGCNSEVTSTFSKLDSLLDDHHQNSKVQRKISDFFVKK